MSARRTTRSTRSASSGPKSDRRHYKFSNPQKKAHRVPDQPNAGNDHDKSVAGNEDGSITSSGTISQPTSGDTGDAANNDEDNDDDHDQPDVHALSRDSSAVVGSATSMEVGSATPAQTPEGEFRTGLKHKTNDDDEMQIEYPQPIHVRSATGVDPISDASASSNSDSDSDADLETDFAIADDDEDYDGVDQVSVASDENVDAAAEEEILAIGEQGISWELDWHDGTTFDYNNILGGNYFDIGDDCEITCSAMDSRMNPFDRRRRSTAASAKDKRLFTQSIRRVSFADEWPMSDISEAPNSDRYDNLQSKAAFHSLATDQWGTHSFKTEEDSTDDEGLNTTVSSPAIALTRRSSAWPESSTVVRRGSQKPSRKRKKKLPVMRRFAFDPNKAVSITTVTPDGKRWIRFREAESSPVKWIMAASNRNKNLLSLDSHVESSINGGLIQRFQCGNDINPPSIAQNPATEFAKEPVLRPILPGTALVRNGSIIDDAADAEALALIDFDGGYIRNGSQSSADMEMPVLDLTITPDSIIKTASQPPGSSAPLPSPAESASTDFQTFDPFSSSTDQVMLENVPLESMESASFGSATPILEFTPLTDFECEDSHLTLNISTPKKRRVSTMSETCPSRSPILKRQRVGMFTELFT